MSSFSPGCVGPTSTIYQARLFCAADLRARRLPNDDAQQAVADNSGDDDGSDDVNGGVRSLSTAVVL